MMMMVILLNSILFSLVLAVRWLSASKPQRGVSQQFVHQDKHVGCNRLVPADSLEITKANITDALALFKTTFRYDNEISLRDGRTKKKLPESLRHRQSVEWIRFFIWMSKSRKILILRAMIQHNTTCRIISFPANRVKPKNIRDSSRMTSNGQRIEWQKNMPLKTNNNQEGRKTKHFNNQNTNKLFLIKKRLVRGERERKMFGEKVTQRKFPTTTIGDVVVLSPTFM